MRGISTGLIIGIIGALSVTILLYLIFPNISTHLDIIYSVISSLTRTIVSATPF